MTKFFGAAYSRGATAKILDNVGPALAPVTVQKMFPNDGYQYQRKNRY